MRTLILIFSILLSVPCVSAQDKEIILSEFWSYMRLSRSLTEKTPFKENVTVETSENPDGGWLLYSSWTSRSEYPDRHHIVYTSKSDREIIQISEKIYSRGVGEIWLTKHGKKKSVNPPAGLFAFDPPSQIVVSESNSDKDITVIRVRSKMTSVKDEDKNFKITKFWLDESGVLIKRESIAYNNKNWVRTTSSYEYDPHIKIEAQIP